MRFLLTTARIRGIANDKWQTMTDRKLQIADFRFADFRFADCRLQIVDFRSQIANLQIADRR
jgi:hypothetical protein